MQRLDRISGKCSSTWKMALPGDKKLFLAGLLMYFLLLLVYFSWQSLGCDERGYMEYVIRWAKGYPDRIHILDDSKTPMVFPALWSFLLKPFMPALQENYGAGFVLWGRAGMFVYPAFMAFILFVWLYRLMGSLRWFWVWAFCLLDPLVIGHSLFVGSDMASAACWLGAAYFSYRLAATLQ